MAMSDLESLLKQTQRSEVSHADMQYRKAMGTMQWFLENDVASHPIHNNNHLQFLVCGEEGFSAIETDLRAATSTIDLVCWGFDPAMELSRMSATTDPRFKGHRHWPRGTTFGDLLAEKGRQGIQVRLLLWYDSAYLDAIKKAPALFGGWMLYALTLVGSIKNAAVNVLAGNAPDMPLTWQPAPLFASGYSRPPTLRTRGTEATKEEVRIAYARAWWHAALSGGLPGVEVRFRKADGQAIRACKDKYLPSVPSLTENSLALAGTHHQKPILIDYHPGQGDYQGAKTAVPHTCGYVMGLNSVTSYWDTDRHLYNDPRREVAYGVGAFWRNAWHVKPLRDYAIRVEGQALADLNSNFVSAWDAADTTRPSLSAGSLKAQRSAVKPVPKGALRAQIVRTQPEEGDATILKTYTQATSNAINYIYVENQYVQLDDWIKFIKALRKKSDSFAQKANAKPGDVPALHLMVVMPQAERGQMVPSTYDTLAQMGQATTVRGYHERVEDLREGKSVDDVSATGKLWLKSSLKAALPPAQIQEELDKLNVKTLAAMLMTYDAGNEARDLLISKRDNDAQEAQAEEEAKTKPDKKASDVVRTEYQAHNIQPRRYREIYIHSKLMLIDDVFITLGSANLNARSMVGDSELNIACADHAFARGARERVWKNLAGEDLSGGDGSLQTTAQTFDDWKKRMGNNASDRKKEAQALGPENDSFIHTYDDPRSSPWITLG